MVLLPGIRLPARGRWPVVDCGASLSGPEQVELTGTGLRPADVLAVALGVAPVAVGAKARAAMEASAAIVQRLADSGEPAYGVSTGFGSLATVAIPAERREQLDPAHRSGALAT